MAGDIICYGQGKGGDCRNEILIPLLINTL